MSNVTAVNSDVHGPLSTLTGNIPYVKEEFFVKKNVKVSVCFNMVQDIASALYEHLQSVGYNGVITLEELVSGFVGLLQLRIHQISGGKPIPGQPWKTIRVPSLLYPVLAQIGKFRDENRGIELLPELEEPFNVNGGNELVATLDKLCRTLGHWGIGWSEGLPKDLYVETDAVFQLEVLDDDIVGRDKVPDPVVILTRLAIEFGTLADVYGSPRVVYATMQYMKRAVSDIIAKQVKNPSSIKT